MVRTFTLFKRKRLSRDVFVYAGELEREPETDRVSSLAYSIDQNSRHFELWRHSHPTSNIVLTGDFKGFLGHSADISGSHFVASAKRNGKFRSGWTFEYMSKSYKWSVSLMSRSWKLKDEDDSVIAEFDRASLSISKVGVLKIFEDMNDESFREMVLVTCEIVHRTVKSTERKGGGGG